eukprot:1394689-Amorphochlora_amoeboformis.AAC.1
MNPLPSNVKSVGGRSIYTNPHPNSVGLQYEHLTSDLAPFKSLRVIKKTLIFGLRVLLSVMIALKGYDYSYNTLRGHDYPLSRLTCIRYLLIAPRVLITSNSLKGSFYPLIGGLSVLAGVGDLKEGYHDF